MAKLTAKQRHGLDTASFALPGRRYPIPDASHARNALARASANASPSQQATIKAKVKRKFPSIEVGGKPKKFADGGPVAMVSKGMEMVGKMMNTDKGKMMKAAESAMGHPKEEKRDTSRRRAQLDAAEERAVNGDVVGGD